LTAIYNEVSVSTMLQSIRMHICVNAVLPRFEMRLFLIFVAIVGCGRFENLSVEFHFLHF
jgi:hypothetical protein